MSGNDGQPTPAPSFATLARLATEYSTAIGAEIARRAEEVRPAFEALTRQLAAQGEAVGRTVGAVLATIRTQQRQDPKP